MPPPAAPAPRPEEPLAEFPKTVLLMTFSVLVLALKMPPPIPSVPLTELPVIVLLMIFTVPLLPIPPPAPLESVPPSTMFPDKVLLAMLTVPSKLEMPPPPPLGGGDAVPPIFAP